MSVKRKRARGNVSARHVRWGLRRARLLPALLGPYDCSGSSCAARQRKGPTRHAPLSFSLRHGLPRKPSSQKDYSEEFVKKRSHDCHGIALLFSSSSSAARTSKTNALDHLPTVNTTYIWTETGRFIWQRRCCCCVKKNCSACFVFRWNQLRYKSQI
jgi:hypothetical protein